MEHVVVLLEGTSPPADGLLWNGIQFPLCILYLL